jgi:hypothetical protein
MICNKEEIEIQEIFENIIMELNTQLNVLENENNELKDKYSKDNGFTKENSESLMEIEDGLLHMKLNAFWGNYNSFIKIEPKLEILYKYYTKFQPRIQRENDIKDLIEFFKNEPYDYRLEPLKHEINIKIEQISKSIKDVASINNYFMEANIDFSIFGLDYHTQDTISKYSKNNYDKLTQKIILCPFCASLFKSAANASYNLMEAQRREYEDD